MISIKLLAIVIDTIGEGEFNVYPIVLSNILSWKLLGNNYAKLLNSNPFNSINYCKMKMALI